MWEDTFVSTTRSIQVLLVVFKKVVVRGPLIREIGYFQSNLIKENLSGKELPIVNKALDGSRWTFQPPISLNKQDSLVKHHYAK